MCVFCNAISNWNTLHDGKSMRNIFYILSKKQMQIVAPSDYLEYAKLKIRSYFIIMTKFSIYKACMISRANYPGYYFLP